MVGRTRRAFIKQSLLGAGALMVGPSLKRLCSSEPRIEISLAQWSLHRALYDGKLDHLDLPAKAKRDYGISAVEYVNGFFGGGKMKFQEAGKNVAYLKELLKRSKDAGVVNHLLMVDSEGPLAAPDERARLSAVENHKKWVEAATVYNSGGVKTRTRRFKGTI